MKTIFMFRSNLRILEDYHKASCTDIEEFKNACHDFWILQLIEFLEQDLFDEAVVWRLSPKESFMSSGFSFIVNNKMKILRQRFVDSFEDIFDPIYAYIKERPLIPFFRGGFPEYDKLVKNHGNDLGLKLYCGTGQRVFPQYGGKYDRILVEDERDTKDDTIPFYKTSSPIHFYMNERDPMYDICFIANFTQDRYKGQQFFIEQVSKSDYLKSLDIVHFGNKPERGEKLCKKYGVTNIRFGGHKSKTFLNQIINKSKFGIVCSNQIDGCPRVITEILSCGTPLLLRSSTRLLNYYKRNGVVEFADDNMAEIIEMAMRKYDFYKHMAATQLDRISLNTVCKKNIRLWK